MPDGILRSALVDYFQAANLPGVVNVYKDIPWFVDGAQWAAQQDATWSAILMVHIDTSKESRISLPFGSGQKGIDYVCSLLIQYQYLMPAALGPGEYEDVWVDGLDELMDAITTRMRADYTAGVGAYKAGAAVFQMGQDNDDLRMFRDPPAFDEAARVWSWNRIEFNVTQIITA